MHSLNACYIESTLRIKLPFSGGFCSSNFLIRKDASFYCVSAYHPFLAIGYPMYFQQSSEKECILKINGSHKGTLLAGTLNKDLDFSIIKINDQLFASTLSNSCIDIYDELQQPPTRVSIQIDTKILMKPARFHRFETTLLLSQNSSPNTSLEPGDSGQLITIDNGHGHFPIGWAVGNTIEGSHLIPYDRLFTFLDKIDFHQIP